MNNSAREHAVVGVFASHTEAETAIKALQAAGIDMKKLSIIGKGYHTEERAVGFYTAGDRMLFWGGQGAFWGGLSGMLFGGALFLIPGLGPIVAMGPLVGWIVGALEGAAVGGAAGILGSSLASFGFPAEEIVKYETEVKAGRYLVLVRSEAAEIERAHTVLGTSGASPLSARAL